MKIHDEAEILNELWSDYCKLPFHGGITIPFSIPGFLYDKYQIAKNKLVTGKEKKAVCLMFKNPSLEVQSLFMGLNGLTADFFTQKGVRVDYINSATSKDLKQVLEDETYQHIVLQGHGSRNSWTARDAKVYTEDISKWMEGLPKKTGYFIQYTCGDNKGIPLGYNVVEDKSKILGYTKPVHLGDQINKIWGSMKGLEALANIAD